ncbi:unnamed protein product [Closterium sp. NIES-54]
MTRHLSKAGPRSSDTSTTPLTRVKAWRTLQLQRHWRRKCRFAGRHRNRDAGLTPGRIRRFGVCRAVVVVSVVADDAITGRARGLPHTSVLRYLWCRFSYFRAAQQPSRPSRPAAEPPEPPSSRAARAARAAELPCSRAASTPAAVPQPYLLRLCDRADRLSLFDLTSGVSPAPPATADSTVRSHWATRDAAARLAVRRHLPTTERAHFSQYKSAQTLYDAVVARYSSPATAALSRLFLPYMFPDLTAFPTVADLITHLRTSDTRFRAALPAEDHFLSVCPTTLTVDLLEERLLAAEQSIVAVGASRGDPRTPIFEECSPSPLLPSVASAATADLGGSSRSVLRLPLAGAAALAEARGAGALVGVAGVVEVVVEAVEGVGVVVGVVAEVEVSAAAVGAAAAAAVAEGAAAAVVAEAAEAVVELVAALHRGVAPVERGGGACPCTYVLRTGDRAGEQCGGLHSTQRCFGRLTDAWHHQFPDATEIPRWGDLSRAGVAVFDLDYDAILAAMYALSTSDEGDCYLCVPPDLGIEAAAPGAASCSFFRDRTTLTPLSRPVAVSLADPSGGPVLASFSTVLPCPAAPSGTLSGLYLPLFSTNLVAASSEVFTAASGSGPESAPCSCRLLSHQTLLWHHRLGHPSLPRLRGMASRVLVSGLPRSLPPLPPGPAPTCVPCVEGRQRTAPHSSEFPPTEAPLQTLHMDVWAPPASVVRVTSVTSCWWLTTTRVTPRSSSCAARVTSPRGGEFSSARLGAFCRAQGIRQTFMLSASPQQNGIAERRIGMVMDVARTSMIHAAAPHCLWPFAVQYAVYQLNLQPPVSVPETSPTLRWNGKVGDASAFRVWGSRAFVRDLSADKLSPRVVPCDVTFDESVPFYRLSPYRTAPLPPPPLFLAPGPPPVDPLPPQGLAPSGVSQVDAVEPVEVAVESGAARGTEPVGAGSGGAENGGAEPWGAESGGAEPGGAEPGGAESARVTSRSVSSRRELLSPQELREWFARRWSHAAGAGGPPVAPGPGGARTGGTGAVGTGGAAAAVGFGPAGASGAVGAGAPWGVGAGVGATRASGAVGAGATDGVGAGVGPAGGPAGATGGTGAAGPTGVGAVGPGGAAGTGAATGGPGAVPVGTGDPARPRPYFVPLLEQVLGLPPSSGPPPPLECPQPVQSQSRLQPVSPLPAPSPYAGPTRGLAERREPASRPVSPVRTTRTSRRAPRPRPPAVPGTHQMMLRPSTAPLRVPLPSPPESSLPLLADPASDALRAASPTVARLLSTVVTDPAFESTAASALVAELVDFAARCRLDYAASLVAESASVCPPSIGGECALNTDVLEDRKEEFQCFAAALPHLVSTQIAPKGDPDAPDIPTPRSYAEAIEGPYSSQWQSAMDAEMASWKSTGTYVDEVPPPGANIVSGMWIFKVKRPPGSPPVFKARYVARGFSQRQGVDCFQTFSPTPKMTTLRVVLHVAAQRNYELHSLDFSTAFLQGSLHEEIWLRRPPGFTGLFPPGTQWSLRQPVYGLRQAPREWHDTLRTTLAALGFAPSTADPSLFLRTDTSLPPFYILVLGSSSVSWQSTRSSSVLGSSCEAEIYAGAMAAQELRWLTYLLADLGEPPRSPPVLYVDNKVMLALCREHRLEHRTKHIALRYFLARELQQRGHLRLAYVASEANTADIFTKALPPGDHQRLCTMLDCVVFLLLYQQKSLLNSQPFKQAVADMAPMDRATNGYAHVNRGGNNVPMPFLP